MVRIELALEVARPADEVFAALADVERLPEWQASALEAHADGPLGQGTRIHERRRVMGRELENELEVAAYDPPRQLTLRALKAPIKFTVDHRLVENGASTVVHVTAEAKPGAFMRLAEPVLARTAEDELRKDFERLKALLEAG